MEGREAPHALGRGRGLSFSLSQKTVCLDAVLVSPCSTQDLVKRSTTGRVLFGATCGPCAHFAQPCPCAQLVLLSSSTRGFQSQGQHAWNSRSGVPVLPGNPLIIQQNTHFSAISWPTPWCPRQGAHCLLWEGLLEALAGSKRITSSH